MVRTVTYGRLNNYMKERTLDIGIGKGGIYTHNSSSMRVGLDIDLVALKLFTEDPLVTLCQADAEQKLPFASNLFHHVDIILPHDELLFALTEPPTLLWLELNRVTKRNADIDIVVDVPMMGNQGVYVHKKPIIISMPHIRIIDSAEGSDFKTSAFVEMNSNDVKNLGTQYSTYLANDIAFGTKIYKMTFKKH